ncbi:RNA polymerase sigma factor [Pedobacter fastidiosus]|uniref:RNA polymerase sigma-70 factor n=1 Tax=Pedobacter fastidiosus TaxID=2765361 RepID=A0ABR7KX60_9SPHI|nr:RNA polymerase sigma-70 factor [Pedobacter fastidiosus]MBC6112699.1 RNA polymerase sigma-70 factor [Pedobacter fastidiosus]
MITHQKTDKQLLEELGLGDENAFAHLFDRHWGTLFAFVSRMIGEDEQAKDIVQNTFIVVWKNKHQLLISDSLMPYLYKVAKNETISLFRKNKVRFDGMDTLAQDLHSVDNPENLLITKELESTIEIEVVKMPISMKKCFQLSRYENKSVRDIAEELSLSEQTVKNNISEALSRLRKRVKLT